MLRAASLTHSHRQRLNLLVPCQNDAQLRRASCRPRRHNRRAVLACAAPETPETEESSKKTTAPVNRVNLFDPAATISRFLTRRFGIVGGLAFVALLASTEGAEIVKALLEDVNTKEVADQAPVTLPDGLVVRDVKLGGGGSPNAGDFVGAHFVVTTQAPGDAEPAVLLDTRAKGRPLAFVFNKSRTAQLRGVEEGLSTMKRCAQRHNSCAPCFHCILTLPVLHRPSGGIRVLDIPPAMGLGVPLGGLPPGPSPFALRVEMELLEVTAAYFDK